MKFSSAVSSSRRKSRKVWRASEQSYFAWGKWMGRLCRLIYGLPLEE
jgi:hypothetical protein